ncbi:hypothetical protein HRbin15_02464 [bacterium HR15]|nr:hypothetical protein HRbin15_02464 [bacterium HR15]
MRALLLFGLLLGIAGWSQPTLKRTDLVARLIEMETCWETHRNSLQARLRATRPLSEVVTAFFAGRFDLVARNLTLTCAALRSDVPPTPAMLYAGSIGVSIPRLVEKAALDGGETTLNGTLFQFYHAEKPAAPLLLRWKVFRVGGRKALHQGILKEPLPNAVITLLTEAAEGDYEAHFDICQGDQPLRRWKQTFSLISKLEMRLAKLDHALEKLGDTESIEWMTVRHARDVLRSAWKGENPETFYPLLHLLQFAERMVENRKKNRPAWQPAPGDYWMVTRYREHMVAFRLFIPRQFKPNRPIPLVVALHGAGGNEHLFFEGYGLGIVLKEARKRGWAVIAPRAEPNLVHVGGALEAAKRLLPIDPKRIYLMGHSMGGAHSFAAIAQFPNQFRAVAIFAGAGKPSQIPSDLPILIAVGEQELDLIKNNIESTCIHLQALNLKMLECRKYDGCDHLMIVREAMPDAFAFFDRAPLRE